MKPKEPTYQVALDALALTTCYPAFLISAEVPVTYMHQFWATVTKHKASYRFKIDNKRFSVNVEVFREILNICPKILGKEFDEPPSEEEALSFIQELGHSGEIKYITDVSVDHLHQPWRTFASIINKCLCGKEDLAYQIDNIDSKKQDKMFYPRFTKIIIHHFLTKDKSISMRNRMLMDTARDDNVLGFKPPKSRKSQKNSDSAISSEESPSKKKFAKAKKVATTKPKPAKKKELVKADRGKGLNVLLEVALSEAAQLKQATKQRKKEFHASHASDSGDGTNLGLGVPDEQHRKMFGTDEGISTKPEVLDVPKYDSESEKESWGDSGEEDDDADEDDSVDESNDGDDNDNDDDNDGNDGDDDDDDDANNDDNQEVNDTNDDDEETDKEEEKINDEEKMDEEKDDEVTKELYNDVNVNLGNRDVDMTDADQGGADQQNVSQESGFEQVEEDAHVTLTPVLDTQKNDEPVQSYSVSPDFTSKLLNLENPSLADNEIASLMDTIVHHEEPGDQTSSLYTVLVMAVPEITSIFTTTVPPSPPFFNPLSQQIASEITTSFLALPDFAYVFKFNERVTNLEKDLSEMKQANQAHNLDRKEEAQVEKQEYIDQVDTSVRSIIKEEVTTQLPQILPQAVSDFATPMIEKNITESLEAAFLAKSSSQPKYTYEAATSLFEFELTKMLVNKMEKNKSYDKTDYKRELYDALIKSYETDKDLFDSYGEIHMNQEFDMGNNDEQPADKEVSKVDCQVARAEEPRTSFDELMDTSFDFSAFVLNRLNIKDLTQEILVGPAFNLLKGTCKSRTELEYHFEECFKATTERLDWQNNSRRTGKERRKKKESKKSLKGKKKKEREEKKEEERKGRKERRRNRKEGIERKKKNEGIEKGEEEGRRKK
ncbi:hypothetical protein Tco_1575806 [Tanacetum coccineum]